MTTAGRFHVFANRKSGKNTDREELWKARDDLRSPDTPAVDSLHRLSDAPKPWHRRLDVHSRMREG
ncbi:hypothetical protein [Streptomyces sp. LN704]|uniref:hypothetical protein n=1 Tax=unclassified Streptomyces TaxID=2593676 RepID=UPI00371D5726